MSIAYRVSTLECTINPEEIENFTFPHDWKVLAHDVTPDTVSPPGSLWRRSPGPVIKPCMCALDPDQILSRARVDVGAGVRAGRHVLPRRRPKDLAAREATTKNV